MDRSVLKTLSQILRNLTLPFKAWIPSIPDWSKFIGLWLNFVECPHQLSKNANDILHFCGVRAAGRPIPECCVHKLFFSFRLRECCV